jgi:hypothetical protein
VVVGFYILLSLWLIVAVSGFVRERRWIRRSEDYRQLRRRYPSINLVRGLFLPSTSLKHMMSPEDYRVFLTGKRRLLIYLAYAFLVPFLLVWGALYLAIA